MKLQAVESAGHVLLFLRGVSFASHVFVDILGSTHCCSLVPSLFFGCGPSCEISDTSFAPCLLPGIWDGCPAMVPLPSLALPSRRCVERAVLPVFFCWASYVRGQDVAGLGSGIWHTAILLATCGRRAVVRGRIPTNK